MSTEKPSFRKFQVQTFANEMIINYFEYGLVDQHNFFHQRKFRTTSRSRYDPPVRLVEDLSFTACCGAPLYFGSAPGSGCGLLNEQIESGRLLC